MTGTPPPIDDIAADTGSLAVAPHPAHTVQLYDEERDLLDETSRLLGSALGGGDAAIAIATADHLEEFANRLAGAGFDVDRLRRSGRYVALDAAGTLHDLMPDGSIEADVFAARIGDLVDRAAAGPDGRTRRVAVFGEMVTLLTRRGDVGSALELERCWNALARSHAFSLRCGYPLDAFASQEHQDALVRLCAEHAAVHAPDYPLDDGSGHHRLQSLALLQHQARMLEQEIAERTRADQQLLERNAELQEVIRSRDEFLYVAAHELRTPITSLRGYAQLLLRDVDRDRPISTERLARSLAMFERQIYRLSQLVGRLLDTSQIQSGKLRIDPHPADLVALVDAAIEQLPPHQWHEVAYDGPQRLEVSLDPLRFGQVLTNLLDNAITFSPGGGTVRISVERDTWGGVSISVSDDGIGIPEEMRDAVFGKFHQAHPESQLSGLGLGLYVCREIVELHGGTIEVEPPASRGTTVTVTLPGEPA